MVVAAEHELSVVQLRLLGVLRDRRPGMLELGAHLGLDKSSMTGLVSRAEKRGGLIHWIRPVPRNRLPTPSLPRVREICCDPQHCSPLLPHRVTTRSRDPISSCAHLQRRRIV
ncbi:hypothetical protein FHX82_005262 [Amycolatopsis bartoniae]|uniref:MarR family transcriptional regulator n=1 Tax=Amycolatopsis bartoniae TaxID=941986 RepID=A0A8H9IM25_9PSEU|nr:MarR family winged helix-turn-helix transcriptional regulator [Amycolatopsis bartoniae]MBB2938186.1 hypothetical protein [Amycolatopsis bartoniae]GHF33280.1 hypothetical protein GCM10017566_02390 [Amycolatopsis bartoniae]